MRLKIIGKPPGDGKYLTGHSEGLKITNADTGEEIEDIRSMQINAAPGDLVIAKLEFCVEELDLDGVKLMNQPELEDKALNEI